MVEFSQIANQTIYTLFNYLSLNKNKLSQKDIKFLIEWAEFRSTLHIKNNNIDLAEAYDLFYLELIKIKPADIH